MLTWQERNALILLAIVTVLIILGAAIIESSGKHAFSTRFSVDSSDGSLVLLEGTIDRLATTKSGGEMILEVNGTQVFIPAQAARGISLNKGDRVLLYGVVQTYRGEKEIVVQDMADIHPA